MQSLPRGRAEVTRHLCAVPPPFCINMLQNSIRTVWTSQNGAFKFTVSVPKDDLGGDCPCLAFAVHLSLLMDSVSGEPDVESKCKMGVGPWSHLANMNVCKESFLQDAARPPNLEATSSVYRKDVQLFKNKEVDGIKMCATCSPD